LIRKLERQLLTFHLVLDIIVTLVALRLAELLRQHVLLGIELRTGPIVLDMRIYIVVGIVWGLIFQSTPVFDSKRTTTLLQEFRGLYKAVALCVLLTASLFYLLSIPPSRLFFLYFWLVDLSLLMGFHALVRRVQRAARAHGYDTRTVVVVGAGAAARTVLGTIQEHAWSGLRVVGVVADDALPGTLCGVPVLGPVATLPCLLEEGAIDEVVIALPSDAHQTLVDLSRELQRFPVVIKVAPDILDVFLLRSTVTDLWGLPLLSVREPAITGVRWAFKRALDLTLASAVLVVLAPLMSLIALAVLITSGRPIILRQERVGEHGKVFPMFKFRTMYPPSSEDKSTALPSIAGTLEQTSHKRPNDPRVTPIGAYLRRLSLDELPQLVNVLRGEMSLVGPRPELPWIVERYEPWQHARHVVRPGMTGWWQINGRSESPLHLNTQFDLFYIQNFSVLLDLRILARTLGAVIRGRGAF